MFDFLDINTISFFYIRFSCLDFGISCCNYFYYLDPYSYSIYSYFIFDMIDYYTFYYY